MSKLAEELGSMDVRSVAALLGIDLQGEDGQPFHCGQRMNVKGGIMGVDYAKCEPCGAMLLRVDSPHTNGGRVFDESFYEELGEAVWKPVPPMEARDD